MNIKNNPLIIGAIGVFLALVAIAAVFISRNTGPFVQPQGAGNQSTQTQPGATNTNSISTNADTVQLKNFSFNPDTLTVKKGTTVTFMNSDSVTHTVTSDDGSFDTGNISSGASQTVTFSKTGTYTYHCSIHPMMKGTIVVE